MDINLKRVIILYNKYMSDMKDVMDNDEGFEVSASDIFGENPILDVQDNEIVLLNTDEEDLDFLIKHSQKIGAKSWDDYCLKVLSSIINNIENIIKQYEAYKKNKKY